MRTKITRGRTIISTLTVRTMLFLCMHAMLFIASSADAGEQPFSQGSARLSVHFGSATAFNRDYSVFGIGGGYYVANGVEVGLDAETWGGNSPRIQQVSPQIKAVLYTTGYVKPYLGAFYRRTFIKGYRNTDTAGARAGAYFLTGGNVYFGAGLAQEVHLNCDRTVYTSCSELYPELLVAIQF